MSDIREGDSNGNVDWDLFDELRKTQPIYVDHVAKLDAAIFWLTKRKLDRENRGVEGKSEN